MEAVSDYSASSPLPFSSLSDADLAKMLSKYRIGLTVEEARKITGFLGRDPTLTEAVIWGIQGSEHSSYKSSRRFLKHFPTSGSNVILGPGEDSGIVAITDGPPGKRWGIVVSHESHNHPSQIVPFEGAATGVGGTVRDVACMGARVIGCMDMLRLGDLQTPELRSIAKEVIRGIGGYGNPLGIPNVGGDTVFDSSYNGNCLVNALAIGIVREDQIIHSYVPEEAAAVGYDIILIGKPTDRSGFGGAAFSSLSLDSQKNEQNSGAVQEPNPFLERHLLESTYDLFDWLTVNGHLHRVSFKDLGAGGIVCATVEQVSERGFGAEIDLDLVHVALDDLRSEVLACAETQERFCWMVHPDLTEHVLKHYNERWDLPSVAENARASCIGKVTADGIFRLRHRGELVCEAKSVDITSGLQYVRPTELQEVSRSEPEILCEENRITLKQPENFQTTIGEVFRAILAHPNHASKSPVIRHYDKTVIGNSVIEPGEADAGVLMPLQSLQDYGQSYAERDWSLPANDARVGAVFAADGNPRYGRISAYWQGANAVVESAMNVAATGAMPRALTDCLNYGNPEIPSQLAALEQGVIGISDAARGIQLHGEALPVISGNVSLYNAVPDGTPIPPSAIVCCIGAINDAKTCVSMRLKQPDSLLYLIGERKEECGGSAYYELLERMAKLPQDSLLGSSLPKPDFQTIASSILFLTKAVEAGHVLSSHDISDGGLLLTLFEMTLPQRKVGGSISLQVDIAGVKNGLRPDQVLFSQTPGFVIEVPPDQAMNIEQLAAECGIYALKIGNTVTMPSFSIHENDKSLLEASLQELQSIWERGLRDALQAL